MGVKYVKDFAYDSGFGFTGSSGKNPVKAHMRKAPALAPAMVEKTSPKMGGKASETKNLAAYNKPHMEGKKGPSAQPYAKGGKVAKLANGGKLPTPASHMEMESIARSLGMTPNQYQRIYNATMEAGRAAPSVARGLSGGKLGAALGAVGLLGGLGGYMMGKQGKPTVTVEELPATKGKARGGKIAKYAKGGKVAKLANGGPPPGQFGRYQTPESMQMMQTFGKKFGMSPQMFERMVNETIAAADKAPAAIKAAGKAGMTKGLLGGGIGGAALGALGTAYGPDIMNYIQSLGSTKKPTVTVEEIKATGKARGGRMGKRK